MRSYKSKLMAAIFTAVISCESAVAQNINIPATSSSETSSENQSTPSNGHITFTEKDEKAEHESEYDFITDENDFYNRGYMPFDWQSFSSYVDDVAKNVVVPDYVKRTGKAPPKLPSIDIATGMITSIYYNDLIVVSRLPGDCGEDGCLIQIYGLVGQAWIKKFEARAFSIVAKPGKIIGSVLLGLVGNADYPSRTVTWTGTAFINSKNAK